MKGEKSIRKEEHEEVLRFSCSSELFVFLVQEFRRFVRKCLCGMELLKRLHIIDRVRSMVCLRKFQLCQKV